MNFSRKVLAPCNVRAFRDAQRAAMVEPILFSPFFFLVFVGGVAARGSAARGISKNINAQIRKARVGKHKILRAACRFRLCPSARAPDRPQALFFRAVAQRNIRAQNIALQLRLKRLQPFRLNEKVKALFAFWRAQKKKSEKQLPLRRQKPRIERGAGGVFQLVDIVCDEPLKKGRRVPPLNAAERLSEGGRERLFPLNSVLPFLFLFSCPCGNMIELQCDNGNPLRNF